jgi:hypothetical protein
MLNRRSFHRLLAILGLTALAKAYARDLPGWSIATFQVDVTCPVGHPCMGGGIANAIRVVDPLECRGIILKGGPLQQPVLLVSIDWCEIRNEAYDSFRDALAKAAGTSRERIILSAIHQHDAPIADPYAEELLRANDGIGSICMPDFVVNTIQKVAAAVKTARFQPVTHLGTGQATVEKVASNRRFLLADGKPSFSRTSATHDAYAQSQPEGTVDTQLKCLIFWNDTSAVASLSFYAVHPMSYYGKGDVSWDFPGMARQARQLATPGCLQLYFSGCSGNVTAGKYNDGSPANRTVLAGRMEKAMKQAFDSSQKTAISNATFRLVKLRLEPRASAGFSREELTARLKTDSKGFNRCLAAMGLSWLRRAENPAHTIDVPCLDFNQAAVLLLPGESYVEYQLYAQSLRPDKTVFVAGYGESATGYVPTEKAVSENDTNLGDWCWVAPGSEAPMKKAIDKALGQP